MTISAAASQIGHGSAHEHGIRTGLQLPQLFVHLRTAVNWKAIQTLHPGLGNLKRPVHQIHRCSSQQSGLGKQDTHASTAAVGHQAHAIQDLLCRPGGHQNMPTTPVRSEVAINVRLQECAGSRQFDPPGRSHATGADTITGQQPALRRQWENPGIVIEAAPVLSNGGMSPHRGVHGRCRQDGTFTRQQDAGEKAVATALNPARKRCGTERGNDHQLSPFRQLDVQGARTGRIPLIGVLQTGLTAERGKRQRTDQLSSAWGQHTTHLRSGLHEPAHEQGRLHRCDAAACSHQNPSSPQQPLHRLSPRRRVPDQSDGHMER